MSNLSSAQQRMLTKLGIEQLNPMQVKTFSAIQSDAEVVLLSPTGTGKTLAFLLPILESLDPESTDIQVLILVPSRELALQIEQVVRKLGTGFKTNAVYGGRSGYQDKIDLKHPPSILIGTPGRVADHIRRNRFSTSEVKTLVLDEFDKSLEIGFASDMKDIVTALPALNKKVLTSATSKVEIPHFVKLKRPNTLNFLGDGIPALDIHIIDAPDRNKLDTLVNVLQRLGAQPGIVFCNFKDTIQDVSTFLDKKNIRHVCFYGGMEQIDRERALIKFRNGTYQLIVATDLAARGIDVPEIKFIIHYQLPHSQKEFTHRNGRTARMKRDGTAYVLKWVREDLPEFIVNEGREMEINKIPTAKDSDILIWKTLYISGGRRDKISKGDIAGLFLKQGKLEKEQLGIIELKQDSSYVSVPEEKVKQVIQLTNNTKLKKKKIRVSLI